MIAFHVMFKEKLRKRFKPRGPYKTKEKVKRVSFFSFFVIYFSHLKLIQSNFSLFAFSLNALFANSSLHAAAIWGSTLQLVTSANSISNVSCATINQRFTEEKTICRYIWTQNTTVRLPFRMKTSQQWHCTNRNIVIRFSFFIVFHIKLGKFWKFMFFNRKSWSNEKNSGIFEQMKRFIRS